MNASPDRPIDDKLFDLTGQVAIVTGTSRGLGQYFARALAKAGADLVLTSRKRETLAEFAAEIEALGRRKRASGAWPPLRKRPSGRFIFSSTMPAAIFASPHWK
jgi:NAD(P)-dependent dehydrogenase (short-subunit alcohol dehydrogenase family)